MACYIGNKGYYERDREQPDDIEVPQRPSPAHVWNNGQWVVDTKVQALLQIEAIEAAAIPIPRRVFKTLILGAVAKGLLAPDLPIVQIVIAEEAQIEPFRAALK